MKFIHLADLHLGKKLKEYDLLEDQDFILKKIINIVDEEKIQAVLISGDIYDKSIPPVGAITLFESFLTRLAERKIQVFIISGNHDSAERMTFGSQLMDLSGIHFAKAFGKDYSCIKLNDEFGDLYFYMLPFIKPAFVKAVYPEEEENIKSYTDACRVALSKMNVDYAQRNVLLAHQFVTGSQRCESEEVSVGGIDNVDVEIFENFDYVALGHIHGPQKIKKESIRYSGTPLKYSFSESKHKKSVPVIEIKEKENLSVKLIPLEPKRDLIELKGTYNQLMSREFYKDLNTDDFCHITLTDEEDILNGFSRLNTIYRHLLTLDYENTRTKTINHQIEDYDVAKVDPLVLFNDFYKMQNNTDLSSEQSDYLRGLIENIWEETK